MKYFINSQNKPTPLWRWDEKTNKMEVFQYATDIWANSRCVISDFTINDWLAESEAIRLFPNAFKKV